MPVLLTTPFNPGDLDSGNTYPRAHIVSFTINTVTSAPTPGPFIDVTYEFGDVVGGVWEKGAASPRRAAVVRGSDYDDMVAEPAIQAESYLIYAGAKRVLYQWLIDQDLLDGTIE